MLIGEYSHSIDDKGRVRIPKNLRDDLGETFYVTKGFDKCIFVFSEVEWKRFMTKVNQNYMKKKDFRRIQRFFTGSANEVSLDGQGRVTISQALRDYGNFSKDVTVVGMNDRVELWATDAWKAYMSEVEDISDMADSLEDLDL